MRHRFTLNLELDFSRTAIQIATKTCPINFHHENYVSKKNEFPSQICDAVIDKAVFFYVLVIFDISLLKFSLPVSCN